MRYIFLFISLLIISSCRTHKKISYAEIADSSKVEIRIDSVSKKNHETTSDKTSEEYMIIEYAALTDTLGMPILINDAPITYMAKVISKKEQRDIATESKVSQEEVTKEDVQSSMHKEASIVEEPVHEHGVTVFLAGVCASLSLMIIAFLYFLLRKL